MNQTNRLTFRFDHKGRPAAEGRSDLPFASEEAGGQKEAGAYQEAGVQLGAGGHYGLSAHKEVGVQRESSSYSASQSAADRTNHSGADAEHAKDQGMRAKDTTAKSKVVPLYQNQTANHIKDLNPWDSAYQDDISALEQLIRDADSSFAHPASAPSSADKKGTEREAKKAEWTERRRTEREWTEPDLKEGRRMERQRKGLEPANRQWPNEDWRDGTDGDRTLQERYFKGGKEALERFFPDEQDEELGWPGQRDSGEREGDGSYIRRKKGPSWFNVLLSVSGALATGALFGYLILSLFIGGFSWSGGGETNGNPGAEIEQQPSQIGLDDLIQLSAEEAFNPDGGGTSSDVPTINLSSFKKNYYLLQYGAFSTAGSRDDAIRQLSDRRLASAMAQDGGTYRVFAGMAGTEAQAKLLAAQLPGLELYRKELQLQAPAEFPFKGDKELAEAFLQQTNSLITSLSELALAQLEQASLSPLGEAAGRAWQDKHKEWTAAAAAMKEQAVPIGSTDYADELVKAVDGAAASMREYDSKPTASALWSVQSSLMKAVLAQKEWFDSLGAL